MEHHMSDKAVASSVVATLIRIANLQSFWTAASLRKAPIDFADVMILSLIQDCEEVAVGAIPKLLGLTASPANERIAKLVSLELITINQGLKDRRARVIKLTEY